MGDTSVLTISAGRVRLKKEISFIDDAQLFRVKELLVTW